MIKVGKEPYLECSSRGDKRFSAMYARIKSMGNRTIEEIYQAHKIFADSKTGLSIKKAKGKKAINMDEVSRLYEKLWELYLKENPELIEILLKYNGYSDIFGKEGCQCQAISIYRIVSNIKAEKAERGVTMARLTNAELLAKIEQQNKVIEELKGVSNMTESTTQKQTPWEYALNQIAKTFLAEGRPKDFTFTVRRLYDSKDGQYQGCGQVLEVFENMGVYIIESITPKREFKNERELKYYEIKISNFDPSIRTTSKNSGKEYDLFFKQLPFKELRTVAV